MMLTYLLIWGFTVLAGLSAVWALVWCIERGQLQQANAGVIFDADDPQISDNSVNEQQTLSTRGE